MLTVASDAATADPLAHLIGWFDDYGILGLFAVGLAERFVPILPSYAVLVAVGIAAAGGAWSLPVAWAATGSGSLIACLVLYALTLALGERRSGRFLDAVGRLAGLSPARVGAIVHSFRHNQRVLSFGTQLVPAIRLVSPAIAGLLRARWGTFTAATAAGIALWNALFIGVGLAAALILPAVNASSLALSVLVVLVAVETLLLFAWRSRARLARLAPAALLRRRRRE